MSKSIEVIVHVYDLSKEINEKFYTYGFGLFHSGVELRGFSSAATDDPTGAGGGPWAEFWFQGHDREWTGIVEIDHGIAARTVPVRTSLNLGPTPLSRDTIRDLVDEMTLAWPGNSYDTLSRNCNHFAEEFVERLRPANAFPGWINRAAFLGRVVVAVVPQRLLLWAAGKILGEEPPASSPPPPPQPRGPSQGLASPLFDARSDPATQKQPSSSSSSSPSPPLQQQQPQPVRAQRSMLSPKEQRRIARATFLRMFRECVSPPSQPQP
jgi:hypothetical protein